MKEEAEKGKENGERQIYKVDLKAEGKMNKNTEGKVEKEMEEK